MAKRQRKGVDNMLKKGARRRFGLFRPIILFKFEKISLFEASYIMELEVI